ncbi:PP0621 family protein [Alloalcanivorax sp. C16-1]|uniref:PP0621 family protein n=1 Tax=Alloalcanivorax sp. C16-1 TaxID=3390051 RepID=UPI0039704F3D
MGLIRLLILAAVVYFGWLLVKRLLRASGGGPGDHGRRRADAPPRSERMVKCHQCGVHVPEGEAFLHRHLTFCSQEHQRLYLERHER